MTWLKPYVEAWEGEFGGTPVFGPMMKALGPLHTEHGTAEVLARWRKYLRAADPMFASPSRFAQTFGAWKPKPGLKELPDPLKKEG